MAVKLSMRRANEAFSLGRLTYGQHEECLLGRKYVWGDKLITPGHHGFCGRSYYSYRLPPAGTYKDIEVM